MAPRVSVIIPVYNVERYLGQCLDCALGQSLKDIEVICVDDGSTDNCASILDERAELDSRLKVIHKANSGFGDSMNKGLDAATGEYVAFLESDDLIVSDAYERLSLLADYYNVEIIKGNYYNLYGSGSDETLELKRLTSIDERYGTVFRPCDEQWSFYIPMMNVLGLFKREFLNRYKIRHNPTPGASHQDMGFWFQTLGHAETMVLVDEPFYKYRQDNAASSMKDDTKAFSTFDEYSFMKEHFLSYPGLWKELAPVFYHRKFGSLLFTYGNCELSLKLPFIKQMAGEYSEDIREGDPVFDCFTDIKQLDDLRQIIESPDSFYLDSLVRVRDERLQSIDAYEKALMMAKRGIKNRKPLYGSSDKSLSSVDVSFIVPVYNTGAYIDECLKSIVSQGVDSFEVICVDDGSTDESPTRLDKWAARDSRIKVFHQQNAGQGAARNRALSVASGKYVQFVDSDDRLAANATDILFNIAIIDDLDALYFDGTTYFESDDLCADFAVFENNYTRPKALGTCVTGEEMFAAFHDANAYRVSPCLALYKKSLLDFLGDKPFPEGIIYEDNVFFARAILEARTVSHTNQPYYERRIRANSTITAESSAFDLDSYFEVYKQLLHMANNLQISFTSECLLVDEMDKVRNSMRKIWDGLSPTQRAIAGALPPSDRTLLFMLCEKANGTVEIEKYKKKISSYQNSNSWKIGRAVTFVPRAVKRSLKKSKGGKK